MRRWRALSMVAIVFAALATPGRLLAQAPAALSPDSPEVVQEASEGFQYFAFLKDPHYNVVEQGALWVVLLVAVAGLRLCRDARRAGARGRPGDREDAHGRPGDPRRGPTRISRRQFKAIIALVFLITAILYAATSGGGSGQRRQARPRAGVPHGGDLLLAGRLRRDEPGGAGQPARRGRGADQLRRGLAARLPHRHDHRHAHRRPRPARRHGHLHGSTASTPTRSCSASASAARCWPCSCGSAAASTPRRPTSAPTSSARSRRASPRTTRATPRRSPTTSATTSATAPGWPPTSSRATR